MLILLPLLELAPPLNHSNGNLNGFGVDLNNWVDLICKNVNGKVIIEANGNKIFETTIKAKPSRIVGIAYHFKGTGAVRSSTIKTVDNQVVFADGFKPLPPY